MPGATNATDTSSPISAPSSSPVSPASSLSSSSSPLSPDPNAHIVPPTDESTVAQCIEALAAAFASDALVGAFAAEAGKTVHEYIDHAFRASLGSGRGTLVEAGDVSAVALWELPDDEEDYSSGSDDGDLSGGEEGSREAKAGSRGQRALRTRPLRLLPNGMVSKMGCQKEESKGCVRGGTNTLHPPSLLGAALHKPESLGPFKREWKAVVRWAKEKHIGLEDRAVGVAAPQQPSLQQTQSCHHHHHHTLPALRRHYHLDFLARNPNAAKVSGAVSAVVRPLLQRARRERRAVWLETSSADVVSMYEYFGFRTVEKVVVGAGKVAGDGNFSEDGKGIAAWLMIVDNRGEEAVGGG